MAQPLPTYLRTYRRKWALSQRELAQLLGGTNRSKISRYERLVRTPNREALIGLEFIFSGQSGQLFPTIELSIVRAVMGNAVELRDVLIAKSDAASVRKCRLLGDLISRSALLLVSYESQHKGET